MTVLGTAMDGEQIDCVAPGVGHSVRMRTRCFADIETLTFTYAFVNTTYPCIHCPRGQK